MTNEKYMRRCIQLAQSGAGNVAPNPMVGAVLVHDERIIGEGYHAKYGQAHAEVNCLNSVKDADRELIPDSILYVSLEPCAHFGRTPPCTNLIIEHKIKKVVIGCVDIYQKVAGKGIQQLKDAGVETDVGMLEQECRELNKRFFTFHQKRRPFIILKWAQSINHKIGSLNGERILISNDYSNRLVHKMRSEEAGILVGSNTVFKDNPSLTTRLWEGKNPVRIVLDSQLKSPVTAAVFNQESPTVIFNKIKNETKENIRFIKIESDDFLNEMLTSLYEMNIQSILVEGGAKSLQSFIDAGLWDEAVIITNEELIIENGVEAPELKQAILERKDNYLNDVVIYYKNKISISTTI